jgi:SAM-dependent methyltransferase
MTDSISILPGAKNDCQQPKVEKMPGHWLLARMGKRVLRPGGLELTWRLLADLKIMPDDDVVEFAPGMGVTARMALQQNPNSYTAVERNPDAVAVVRRYLNQVSQTCVLGTAEETGLPNEYATVVYGEAMLSMQPEATKLRIVREAARLLRPGGRYGIHELCVVPDHIDASIREAIRYELSDEIHVGVKPLTRREWWELLQAAGLKVISEHPAPMHLLEPKRVVKDEGLLRAIRFAWNVATHSMARRRVLKMRKVFKKFNQHLAAIAIVAEKPLARER